MRSSTPTRRRRPKTPQVRRFPPCAFLSPSLSRAAIDRAARARADPRVRAVAFDELAEWYMYRGGDGCGTETGEMFISAPAALLYKTQQLLCCRGLLPDWLKEAAACFFADHSLNEREDVGMGQPIRLGLDSPVRYALAEAKCHT